MAEDLTRQPPDATLLGPEELEGLLPGHIRTREELNQWEYRNIVKARNWAFSRRREVLSEDVLRELHRRMFNDTWNWAGTYRRSDKNIGIPWEQVHQGAVRTLCDDISARIAAGHDVNEVAVQFHHRLTWVHPFPNGNGRHARLATDMFLHARGVTLFTWGRQEIASAGDNRHEYIGALHEADAGNLDRLRRFVRSGT